MSMDFEILFQLIHSLMRKVEAIYKQEKKKSFIGILRQVNSINWKIKSMRVLAFSKTDTSMLKLQNHSISMTSMGRQNWTQS